MAVLLQDVSRELFKTQSHKKADMSKVNSKFPNCFQPVQLFLSMSGCLLSFVAKGLRGGETGIKSSKKFQVNNHIFVLNTVINLVKSHLVAKLSLLFGQRWQQFSKSVHL